MTFSRVTADWPAPAHITAYCTCRDGGFSHGPYSSFNLGLSVGDELTSVQHNRNLLQQEFSEPLFWLHQVHGNTVVELAPGMANIQADAVYTSLAHHACVVKTADCLPILLTNKTGTEVAAIHGGWRSLALDIIANTVNQLESEGQDLMAWLGPAISQSAFEVGPDVKHAFVTLDPRLDSAFIAGKADRLHADLYQIARCLLNKVGVQDIFGGDFCTYTDAQRFYSYRRDKATGRMASVICIQP